MRRQALALPALLCLGLVACATTADTATESNVRPTSNSVTGAAAVSNAGSKAIGAYGALGTSDDVRGRSGSSSASVLTGRATMAGSDSGTRDDASDDKDAPPPR